jgi:UPF0755 protein
MTENLDLKDTVAGRYSGGCRTLAVILSLVFGVMLCVVGGLFLTLAKSPNSRLNPVEGAALRVMISLKSSSLQVTASADSSPIKFVIAPGDSATTIGQNLVSAGFISDATLFRNYVRYYGIDANLQAGTYFLRRSYTLPEIAQALTDAGANAVTIQVIEGWRMEQIAAAVDQNSLLNFKSVDFLAKVRAGAPIPADFAARNSLPTGASLEGFLFPDTYQIPAGASADELVKAMLDRFSSQVTDQMRVDAARQGLTMYQTIILASIVEREAVVDEDRPLIASVYLNRLRQPMTLDADPTIQYALGNTRDGSWWPNITLDDYQGVNSPFNTYRNLGLPPTPIASPGLASIKAVIYAPVTPYFFFRADCSGDGKHKFARTLQEQQANQCP